MQFSPALNGDRPSPGAGAQVHPVPVWIEIPIQFQGKKQQYEPEDRSRTEVATVQRASDRSPGVIQLQTITVSSAEQSAARGTQTVERPFTTLVRERDFVTDPYRDTTGDGAAQQRFARFAEQLRSAQQDPDIRKRPTFMPFTKAPELLHREEIGRALVREYPPLLRDAGIGGTTLIWFFINEKGEVENTAVKKTSGTPALDEASLRIAKLMRFTPAKNRDKVVPVWIEIPIQFQAK
jgi:TonB family protein